MSWHVIAQIIGGIGLFLIGIELMRSGFKQAAGTSLRRILSDRTDTTTKGVLAGFLVSSAVQSASAVTLTLIGFVNAHILRLRQAISVVLGSNLGKITTAWLIMSMGLNIDIAAFALPLLGLGILLKAFLKKKRKGYGLAACGFALLFLGISTLKNSVGEFTGHEVLSTFAIGGFWGHALYFFAGLLMTIVTQSSSAALAVALSVASAGLIPVSNAVVLLVGLNLGTTSGAYVASMQASPNARRLAAAHVAFNLMCTLTGLALFAVIEIVPNLKPFFQLITQKPIFGLVVFYNLFIVLGLFAILPFQSHLVTWLKSHFHKTASLGHPVHIRLDKEELFPHVAVKSLQDEVIRFGQNAAQMMLDSLAWNTKNGWVYGVDLSDMENELDRLTDHIHDYAAFHGPKISDKKLNNSLQMLCRSAQHFALASDYCCLVGKTKDEFTERIEDSHLEGVMGWSEEIEKLVQRIDGVIQSGRIQELKDIHDDLTRMDEERRNLRYHFIQESIVGGMKSAPSTAMIDIIENTRRAMKELMKGANKLWRHQEIHAPDQTEPVHTAGGTILPLKKSE